VSWQAVGRLLGWDELVDYYGWAEFPWHTGTASIVYLMLLSGLLRRHLLLCGSIGLLGLSLFLRPSSTLAFCALVALGFVGAYRLGAKKFLRRGGIVAAAAILLANLAILESADVAASLYAVEPGVKEEALHGTDNNLFRLGIIAAARHEMTQHSLLFGKVFTGNDTVNALPYVPYLGGIEAQDTGIEPIHCDYISMILEGGLFGYALLGSIFLGMALLCAKGARLADGAGDRTGETLFDAFQAMTTVFMLYISANPVLPDLQDALPYLMLIPIAIFLARAQPGFIQNSKPAENSPVRGALRGFPRFGSPARAVVGE